MRPCLTLPPAALGRKVAPTIESGGRACANRPTPVAHGGSAP